MHVPLLEAGRTDERKNKVDEFMRSEPADESGKQTIRNEIKQISLAVDTSGLVLAVLYEKIEEPDAGAG